MRRAAWRATSQAAGRSDFRSPGGDDWSGDVVVRLHEALDVLRERPPDDTTSHEVTDGTAKLRPRPCQILTLRLPRPRAAGGTCAG